MAHLSPHDIMTMFMALAVLLGAAKLAGELMQKLDQPSVLGEIMAGILLGPTVLGHFKPGIYAALFPSTGAMPITGGGRPVWCPMRCGRRVLTPAHPAPGRLRG